MKKFRTLLCIASVLLSAGSARANVYATDITINGGFTAVTNPLSSPVTISYRLNQGAGLGVIVAVMQGTNQVATLSGGTNMGLNTNFWGGTNNSGVSAGAGPFSFSITAADASFTNWQQISVDTNAGNYAPFPEGMAVDNNTNSPYYGRVVVGSTNEGGVNPISGAALLDGLYKMNADGSFADEGGFGYGGYTSDDFGDTARHAGEMPSGSGVVPWRLRIGDDDRIYMMDFSGLGAILAFDMQMTTNQIVIDEGTAAGSKLGGPHNYSKNPDLGNLYYGLGNFDVTATTTANAAIWLCDYNNNNSPNPNWGVWVYRLVNGASDPNDTKGTQAVAAGGDLSLGSSGGCMVDTNLDIFCAQSQLSTNAAYEAMIFPQWNGGNLPPEAGGTTYALGTHTGQVLWGDGANDPTFEAVQDIVINSRTSPTMVACPMAAGNDNGGGGGIRVLNVIDGSIVSVTNGSSVQTLTNLDWNQAYTCAAWDNVGNLYGASPTRQVWRVWSPPGANTNTTVALGQVIMPVPPVVTITGITANPTTTGCASVTISFSSTVNLAPTAFNVLGASAVNGSFSAVSSAVITGVSGAYQAVFTNCSTAFYEIEAAP